MNVPEYTISLLIWILPIIVLSVFLIRKRLLSPEKSFSLLVTVAALAAVGIILDLLFAARFFSFPQPAAVCGIKIQAIPIEEFIFYITGFWFIIFLYVFCDEWFLKKYNVPDEQYARYRSKLKKLLFINMRGIYWAIALFVVGILFKQKFNPEGDLIPGYFTFLLFVAYTPFVIFFRVSRKFINWPAFLFCLIITTLISIIWEVTLAIPRGYWGYQSTSMLGIFIPFWHFIPIEAVTVWIFSTLVILVYEFIKICYFTKDPSVPGHNILLKIGRNSRKRTL